MEALFAKAEAIGPLKRKRPQAKLTGKGKKTKDDDPHGTRHDHTLHTVSSSTKTPRSLSSVAAASADTVPVYTPTQVPNKKLRTKLHAQHALTASLASHTTSTQELLSLAAEDVGSLQVEGELERTWRVSQDEIVKQVGAEAAKGRRELTFDDGGVKRMRWTRNGRHLAFVSGKGGSRVSSVDWIGGKVNCEIELNVGNGGAHGGKGEGARDVCFLQDQSFLAVAQRRNVFIYDRDGVEVHRLGKIIDPVRLEWLPWHWLLVGVTNTSHLTYTDTTTGTIVADHCFTRSSVSTTRLSPALSVAQNPHTAVVYMGHTNGQVSLWTPNMSKPVVQVLAHLGGVACVGVDPSDRSGVAGGSGSPNTLGRYMATAGRDHKVKIWDCRYWKGVVREWTPRSGGGSSKGSNNAHADIELEWSQRGYLGVAAGGCVNVYHPPAITAPFVHVNRKGDATSSAPPPLYLTHPVPHRPITSVRFEPYTDVLALGHARGLSSIIVPGAGDPQFDSLDADPFEHARSRREREVKGLLDKLAPDMIALDPSFIGALDAAVAKTITEDGVRKTTAAQSLLGEKELKRLPVDAVEKAGGRVGKEFARMSRIERLEVQGRLDLEEVGANAVEKKAAAVAAKAAKDTTKDSDSEASDDEDDDGESDEEGGKPLNKEEREKKRMRGRNKTVKRFLRKQRKNVVDPAVIAIRAKVEKIREEEKDKKAKMRQAQARAANAANNGGSGDVEMGDASQAPKRKSALDRFARRSGQ